MRPVVIRLAASIVTVAAFGFLALGSSDSSNSPRSSEPDEVGAYTMCQQFTEQRLKAPSTAKWPWGYSDKTTNLGGGRFRVRTYVDAQNSFGAMIRNQVDCTVKYIGNDRWQLENLAVE